MRRLSNLQERVPTLRAAPGAGLAGKAFEVADDSWKMLGDVEDALVKIPRHDPPHPHAEGLERLNKVVREAMMALEKLREISARSVIQDSVDERASAPALNQSEVEQYKKERAEIEKQYTVRDGRIASPGKFEGEMIYTPYFWSHGLEGMADDDDGETFTFRVTPEEKAAFPELAKVKTVRLRERDDGFVVEV